MNKNIKILSVLVAFIYFFSSVAAPAWAAVSYTYDANGNMLSDGTKCSHYNDANQLDKVTNCSSGQTIAEYVYDYNGNRLVKKVYASGSLQKTTFSPSDEFETEKLASNGATKSTSYYFANDQLIAKKDPSGVKTYFHNDHLGSASVITNQAGSSVESTTYDPWGEIKTGGLASKFLYTGQEHDSETGLEYYNARYYNSHIRRFTQADSFTSNIYNPQDLNVYSYVLNNPLRYTDPTGHFAETALDVAFIAADLNSIRNDPTNAWNYAALVADGLGALTPVGTGFGLGVKIVEHGGDAAKAANSYTKPTQQAGKTAQNVVKQSGSQKQISHPFVRARGGELVFGTKTGSKETKIFAIARGNKDAKLPNGAPYKAANLLHFHLKQSPKPNDRTARTSYKWHRPWETIFRKWFR